MSTLIAIDPGQTTGWARFSGTQLMQCGFTVFTDLPIFDSGEVIIEVPRIYPHGSKGDPNDILELALKAGEARKFYRERGLKITEVHPRTWKGTLKKEIHHARVLKALALDELGLLPAKRVSKTNPHGIDNNCLDAVGLGLWHLGRTR